MGSVCYQLHIIIHQWASKRKHSTSTYHASMSSKIIPMISLRPVIFNWNQSVILVSIVVSVLCQLTRKLSFRWYFLNSCNRLVWYMYETWDELSFHWCGWIEWISIKISWRFRNFVACGRNRSMKTCNAIERGNSLLHLWVQASTQNFNRKRHNININISIYDLYRSCEIRVFSLVHWAFYV